MASLNPKDRELWKTSIRVLCRDITTVTNDSPGVFSYLGVFPYEWRDSTDRAAAIVASIVGIRENEIPDSELIYMLRGIFHKEDPAPLRWKNLENDEYGIQGCYTFEELDGNKKIQRHVDCACSEEKFKEIVKEYIDELGIQSAVEAYYAGVPAKDITI